MSRLLTAKRRARRGLDSGPVSATLPISGGCQLRSDLHSETKSLTDLGARGGGCSAIGCPMTLDIGARWIVSPFSTNHVAVERRNVVSDALQCGADDIDLPVIESMSSDFKPINSPRRSPMTAATTAIVRA